MLLAFLKQFRVVRMRSAFFTAKGSHGDLSDIKIKLLMHISKNSNYRSFLETLRPTAVDLVTQEKQYLIKSVPYLNSRCCASGSSGATAFRHRQSNIPHSA